MLDKRRKVHRKLKGKEKIVNGIPEVSNWGVVLKDGTLLPGFSSSAAAQEHIKSLELEGAAVRPLGQNNRQIPLCPSCWKPKEG